MRMQRILISFISFLLAFQCLSCYAQVSRPVNDSIVRDSTVIKLKYGLRLGTDIGKLLRTAFEEDYSGFEAIGDFRLTNKIYLAGEIGIEERTISDDFLNVTAQGTYLKVGFDYNLYRNWLNMDNMIFAGFRLGGSIFNQTLNSFTIYDINNQYWNDPVTIDSPVEFDGLSAAWAELLFGIKAELVNNLYMGLNIQLKGRVTEDSPENFENLWIPGFNRTFDSGVFGWGFGYTLAYRIPVYKKDKVIYEE
jgi:hypothetical protein